MRGTRRARRMTKRRIRSEQRSARLNMISLMDIFTILVFFLLVNATSDEVLPSPKEIVLPESVASAKPRQNLVIAINHDVIRLQGNVVISVKDAMTGNAKIIDELLTALTASSKSELAIIDKKGVTIMGDRDIPYSLLKKIMFTCAQANFEDLSFAVTQTLAEAGS